MTRRGLLARLLSLGSPLLGAQAAEAASAATDPRWQLSDAQWKARLSPAAYAVLRQEGTERPFSSPLNAEKRAGIFHCAGCDLPLFSSEAKYDSGTGWPSFWDGVNSASITTLTDSSHGMVRTEIMCAKCGSHLGHLFDDGPTLTGKRYCVNSTSISFKGK